MKTIFLVLIFFSDPEKLSGLFQKQAYISERRKQIFTWKINDFQTHNVTFQTDRSWENKGSQKNLLQTTLEKLLKML